MPQTGARVSSQWECDNDSVCVLGEGGGKGRGEILTGADCVAWAGFLDTNDCCFFFLSTFCLSLPGVPGVSALFFTSFCYMRTNNSNTSPAMKQSHSTLIPTSELQMIQAIVFLSFGLCSITWCPDAVFSFFMNFRSGYEM